MVWCFGTGIYPRAPSSLTLNSSQGNVNWCHAGIRRCRIDPGPSESKIVSGPIFLCWVCQLRGFGYQAGQSKTSIAAARHHATAHHGSRLSCPLICKTETETVAMVMNLVAIMRHANVLCHLRAECTRVYVLMNPNPFLVSVKTVTTSTQHFVQSPACNSHSGTSCKDCSPWACIVVGCWLFLGS